MEMGKDNKYKFIQYIAPRDDFKYGSLKATEKPFASYHVSKDSKEIIKESGFDYPIHLKVSRFMVGNEENIWSFAYEYGPKGQLGVKPTWYTDHL